MEETRFDEMTKVLGSLKTRRLTLGGLLARVTRRTEGDGAANTWEPLAILYLTLLSVNREHSCWRFTDPQELGGEWRSGALVQARSR